MQIIVCCGKVIIPSVGLLDQKAKAGEAILFSNPIERLKQIPGVRQVGAGSDLPMDGSLPRCNVSADEAGRGWKTPDNTDSFARQFDALFGKKQRIVSRVLRHDGRIRSLTVAVLLDLQNHARSW